MSLEAKDRYAAEWDRHAARIHAEPRDLYWSDWAFEPDDCGCHHFAWSAVEDDYGDSLGTVGVAHVGGEVAVEWEGPALQHLADDLHDAVIAKMREAAKLDLRIERGVAS